MTIQGDALRGHTDMMILSILNKNDSYGYEINKTLEELSESSFTLTEATLYTSFKRLLELGYVVSYWLDSETGKKRKYYSITEMGKHYLENQILEWQHTKRIIDDIIKY